MFSCICGRSPSAAVVLTPATTPATTTWVYQPGQWRHGHGLLPLLRVHKPGMVRTLRRHRLLLKHHVLRVRRRSSAVTTTPPFALGTAATYSGCGHSPYAAFAVTAIAVTAVTVAAAAAVATPFA